MARKFIQMGMTRAKRYSNHKGGRKYDSQGNEKAKVDHDGKAEKEEASRIFRKVWEKCKTHEGYLAKKKQFLEEQKAWDQEQRSEQPRVEYEQKLRQSARKKSESDKTC